MSKFPKIPEDYNIPNKYDGSLGSRCLEDKDC